MKLLVINVISRYKFLEINYYRPVDRQGIVQQEDGDKEEHAAINTETEARVEKVVIFIPDIWSCMPHEDEWAEIKATFEKRLASLISTPPAAEPSEEVNDDAVEMKSTEDAKLDESKTVEEDESEDSQNLSQMKVVELKAELSSRGLDTKGVKAHLVKRLQEALDKERGKTTTETEVAEAEEKKPEATEEEEKVPAVVVPETPAAVEEPKKVEETKEMSEKERKRLEKLYKLNDKPSIIVQPNKNARAGRFECMLMTLETLLEYRSDDQKEHIFEISLFAEQMNEMLQRDAAFSIFKSLSDMPDLVVETSEPALKKVRLETEKPNVRKSKMIADMNLLFSFCVFDQENCGYLKDHDLEDIIHCIGLNFSRSQVRKLISKVPNKRGSLMYREVIDKDVVEGSEEDVAVLKDRKYALEKMVELSKGNKAFFEETDPQEAAALRSNNLNLLDALTTVEHRKLDFEAQLTFIKDELGKLHYAAVRESVFIDEFPFSQDQVEPERRGRCGDEPEGEHPQDAGETGN